MGGKEVLKDEKNKIVRSMKACKLSIALRIMLIIHKNHHHHLLAML